MKSRASLLLSVDKDNYLPDIKNNSSAKKTFDKRTSISKKNNKYSSKFLRDLHKSTTKQNGESPETIPSGRKPVEKATFTIPLMSDNTNEINKQLAYI